MNLKTVYFVYNVTKIITLMGFARIKERRRHV